MMEIKDYIRFLAKNYILIIAITLLFAVATYIISVIRPDTYQSSASIEVTRFESEPQTDVPYYQYDNYYAYQTASVASDNMIGWASSAATTAEIYKRAGYDIPSVSLKELAKTFTAVKDVSTSAVISLSYSSSDQEKSARMIETATKVLKEKVEAYNKVTDQNTFTVQTSTPVTIAAPKMEALNTVIAAFIGFLIALGSVSIREAIKSK